MKENYSSGKISITAAATEIDPSFDMSLISCYSESEFLFRVRNQNAWGSWVSVPEKIPFEDTIPGQKIEVKSLSGTITLYYFIRGE